MKNRLYYSLKPVIPRSLQIYLRRRIVALKRASCKDVWPIDNRSGCLPRGWTGWPGKKQFALVLTHDVETAKGQEKCLDLLKLEQDMGFRSSFNFVPGRYDVSSKLRHYLDSNGFEVGVHDLYHDGKLYRSRRIFHERAKKINQYLKEWNSVGFRSGSMLCNLQWIHALNIEYDASSFDSDPFEPNPKGVNTIFPFRITGHNGRGYIELPYTLPQDFTLFILMREGNIDIWKRKLDWIAMHGGMALMDTHPDYMNFNGTKSGLEEYPAEYYRNFLDHLKAEYEGQYWHALPKDMAYFMKKAYDEAPKPEMPVDLEVTG